MVDDFDYAQFSRFSDAVLYCADGVLFHLLMIDMYITIRCYSVLLSADTMKFMWILKTLEASKIIREVSC